MLAAAFAARFTLAEARRKRASYLQVAAHEMNLANVEVERRRASAESIASGFDLVTARAFGTSVELYEIAAAALRPAGTFFCTRALTKCWTVVLPMHLPKAPKQRRSSTLPSG